MLVTQTPFIKAKKRHAHRTAMTPGKFSSILGRIGPRASMALFTSAMVVFKIFILSLKELGLFFQKMPAFPSK